ncbi:MAG TPA: hypothetical protein PKD31_01125, partial [Blastocatellia bacterium]|nr:hypothetical protein [Blastocatellia bacterium]
MVKIKGLVRAFNRVRAQLQSGLPPGEVEAFKQHVRSLVRDVEAICREHRITPNHLPGPSRLAYQFLKTLDLDNLPISQTAAPVADKPAFKIKNVVKIGEHLAARIWQNIGELLASSAVRAQLLRDVEGHAAAIERVCGQHGQTPAVLEAPSRQTYCWLKFLCTAENLTAHLVALDCARKIIGEQPLRPGQVINVHLICQNAIWRRNEYRDAVVLKVNQGFLNADPRVWRAIIHAALLRRDADNDQAVREFTLTDEFSETLFELESFAAVTTSSARGHVHDLDESFARVNAAYFDGRIAKPFLIWNRTLTASKFGHYQPSRDTIMLSVSLDDAKMPAYVVDFVMYHELLHKKHGTMIVNGRRLSHSPAFREDERQFAQYAEAERRLKELAMRNRGWSFPTPG